MRGCGPCACLLAGGCGAWRLLARRRRRRRRHSQGFQVDILAKVLSSQEIQKKSTLEKMGSHAAHLFAQNVDASLAGIVI